MRPSEIENWTLKIIAQLKAEERIEETRVEVKTTWIDPQDAARIIAGQANAARGEPTLWIIGVDEKNTDLVGVKKEELAIWWEQVKSNFEGVHPSMTDINVPVDGVTVVALYFDTDRAPFVIKNPNFNKTKDKIRFEVPWREGTSTRTATRSDLLRLLIPITHKPKIEVLGGELICSENGVSGGLSWNLVALKLYVEPAIGEEINFVFHRCEVSFEIIGVVEPTILSDIRITPPYVPASSSERPMGSYLAMKPDSVTAEHTRSEMIFRGPGRGDLKGSIDLLNSNKNLDNSSAIIIAKLAYSHEEQPIIIRKELAWSKPHPSENFILGRWTSYS